MPTGILAQPVGPGPAAPAPLMIDSNMTFPQFMGTFDLAPSWRDTYASFTVSAFDGQGQLVIVPKTRMIQDYLPGVEIVPQFNYVTGITTNGQTVGINIKAAGANNNRTFPMGYNAYKIWPTGDQSYGITFSNSANFFSISDSGVVGQCAWAYRGAVGDGFKVQNANANSVVFGNWNQGDVTVAYDSPSQSMIICSNHSNFNGSNRGGVVNDMRIAVFNNGGGVPEHNGGLNIYSPNGQQCVFSSYNTPFIINKFFPSSGGATGLAIPMACLNRAQGAMTFRGGGWMWVHERSMTMVNSVLGTGYGPIVTSWTDRYPITIDINVPLTYPMLDGSTIFA